MLVFRGVNISDLWYKPPNQSELLSIDLGYLSGIDEVSMKVYGGILIEDIICDMYLWICLCLWVFDPISQIHPRWLLNALAEIPEQRIWAAAGLTQKGSPLGM